MKASCICLGLLVGMLSSTQAQPNSISVSEVNRVYDGIGVTLEFRLHINVTMGDPGGLWVYSNGFRVYSPDDLGWGQFSGERLPGWPHFGFETIEVFGTNGVGADTLVFIAEDSAGGFLTAYDGVAWSVSVEIPGEFLPLADRICLDKVEMTSPTFPGNTWRWHTLTDSLIPRWSGPYCISIQQQHCEGTRGNIQLEPDCDWSDQFVDVIDLTALIDHLYINYTPICSKREADLSPFGGFDGVVDVADLSRLIDHLFVSFEELPPCL